MTITIERFTAADITEATLLTLLTWGEEMALANEHLKNVLYEAMVRYYFRSSEFSYKMVDEDGSMQGFLLAAPLTARDHSQKWLEGQLREYGAEEQDLVYNYLRYLSYNGQQVRKLAQDKGSMSPPRPRSAWSRREQGCPHPSECSPLRLCRLRRSAAP